MRARGFPNALFLKSSTYFFSGSAQVEVEEGLYRHAQALDITLVTITQRTALVKYHARELRLVDGEGDWELREIRAVGGQEQQDGEGDGGAAPQE